MKTIVVLFAFTAVASAAIISERELKCMVDVVKVEIDRSKSRLANLLERANSMSNTICILVGDINNLFENLKKEVHQAFKNLAPKNLAKTAVNLMTNFTKNVTVVAGHLNKAAKNLQGDGGQLVRQLANSLSNIVLTVPNSFISYTMCLAFTTVVDLMKEGLIAGLSVMF